MKILTKNEQKLPKFSNSITLALLRKNVKIITKSFFSDWKLKNRLELVDRYFDLLDKWEKSHRSTLHVLRRVDMLRLHYVRHLVGNPLHETDKIRLNAGGLPTCLTFLPLRSLEHQDVKFILTLLTATRAITLDGIPDIQAITQSAESSVNPKLSSFVDTWVEKLKQGGLKDS
jgi:hypothetical protein